MAGTLENVSTISGTVVNVVVDHDNDPISTSSPDRISAAFSSFDESYAHDGDEFTTISLNGLIQKTLSDHNSEIGKLMKAYLANDEPIPKKLIYTILKQALEHADQTKPVLLVDRRLSVVTKSEYGHPRPTSASTTSSATQTESHRRLSHLETKFSNGIAVISTLSNERDKTHHALEIVQDDGGQPRSLPRRILAKLKHALLPPDEPVPAPDPDEKRDQSNCFIKYLKKMRGGTPRPPYEQPLEALQSLIASFLGILILTVIDYFLLTDTDYTLVIGSFGATAVLVFCAIKSPLAQPRNVLGGHILAAIIGAACQLLLGQALPWLAAALAVSISIAVMSLTNTVHPPAGATALIAVYSNDAIHKLGFMYILVPVLAGAVILLLVAVLVNNMFPSRRYPMHWL